jgi:hypothetical protein
MASSRTSGEATTSCRGASGSPRGDRLRRARGRNLIRRCAGAFSTPRVGITQQTQLQEPEQDVAAPLVAGLQSPIAHQPGQRPLHHRAVAAQPLARLDAAAGDPRDDPASAQGAAAAWVVVALVAVQLGRALAGPPGATVGTLDGWDGVHHGLQQHRVVGVGRRQPHGQWNAAAVDQQVVLAPRRAAVDRIGTGQGPPRLARTLMVSRLARDQSSCPAWPSWSSRR